MTNPSPTPLRPLIAPPPQPPASKRMTLAAITDGPRPMPWAILVYGPEGVGKSSLAVDIDDAVTVDADQSANYLPTKKFPTPHSLADVYEAVDTLRVGEHSFKTLVVDTIDRVEAMIWAAVVARAARRKSGEKIESIEDFGYGKGYQQALDEWRILCARLDELRSQRGMNILLLGHASVRTFKNPEGPDYDRHTMRVEQRSAGFIREWCDAVLFARFEDATQNIGEKGRERAKGVSGGTRILCTRREAAYDAKNRYSFPAEMPLSWPTVNAAIIASRPTTPESFRAAIADRLEQLKGRIHDDEHADLTERAAKADDAALPRALDYLNARLR